MNWKQRGAKLLSVFFMGYGGGFVAVLPTDYLQDQNLNLFILFLAPILSGLAMMWPQVSKMFNEISKETGSK